MYMCTHLHTAPTPESQVSYVKQNKSYSSEEVNGSVLDEINKPIIIQFFIPDTCVLL